MINFLISSGGNLDLINIIVYLGSICFVLFCATPLHEFAHALVAVKLGDDTPRLQGRLTINPTAHIDPIGAILIFLFGFGYAKPVNIRMRRFKNPKVGMALVAIAGPVCNLIQAFVSLVIANAVMGIAYMSSNEALTYICMFFIFAAQININLAVFNLLPIPPLDGSRIATLLIPQKYYFKIMQYERYIMIGLMVLLFLNVLDGPLYAASGFLFEKINQIASFPLRLIVG